MPNQTPTADDDRLSAYLDNEITGPDRAALEQEIAGSAPARQRLQELKDVSTLLKTWDTAAQDQTASAQFKAFVSSGGTSVSAQLQQQALEDENIPIAPVVRRAKRSLYWLKILAAVLIGVALLFTLHRLFG